MSNNAATARQWKTWRKAHLMTQQQLADVLHISRRTVQYCEAGKVLPSEGTQKAFEDLVAKHKKGKELAACLKTNPVW